MAIIQTLTTNTINEPNVYKSVEDRNIIFNSDDKALSVKYNGKNPINLPPDKKTLILNDKEEISLENAIVEKALFTSEKSVVKGNDYLGKIDATKNNIILLIDTTKPMELMSGTIFLKGSNTAAYHIDVTSNELNKNFFLGSSCEPEKDKLVEVSYSNKKYIGIETKMKGIIEIYFNGLDNRTIIPTLTLKTKATVLGEV